VVLDREFVVSTTDVWTKACPARSPVRPDPLLATDIGALAGRLSRHDDRKSIHIGCHGEVAVEVGS
jgi:hypothetical protein